MPDAPPPFFSLLERGLVPLAIAAGAFGLLLPGPEFLKHALPPVLLLIMFFTCLKLPLRSLGGHLRRPLLLGWVCLLVLVLTPLACYGLTLAVLPAFAAATLVVVAMPGGMMNSSLAEICGGDSALALVITGLTTLLCPVTVPLLLWLTGVRSETAVVDAWLLLKQAGWLSLFVFLPPLLAALARRCRPERVGRFVPCVSGLNVLLLVLTIYAAMSLCRLHFAAAEDFLLDGLKVLGWTTVLCLLLYLAGWFIGGGRGTRERLALSINVGYVNNMLGLVFALEFFKGEPVYILPAILMEFPMHLWLWPLRRLGRLARRRDAADTRPTPGATGGENC